MRAAGYIRVSTEEQVKHGWNLGADRERIEATIAANGWERHDIYDDGGRQGDDPDRPGFLKMLAEADQYDVLIIRDLDRFSRRLAIYAAAVDDLIAAEVTLYEFAGDAIDLRKLALDNEDDRALADVKAVFAQMEKAKIKRRVRQAKRARASAGGHPGGKRPYGYQYTEGGPLAVDLTEADVVKRMFAMAEATSQRKIARILNDEGIVSSKGKRWAQSTIARVLGSPLYIGKIRRKVNGEYVMYDGQHEPIVDEALWHRVNASRSTPERREGGRPMHSAHLLTRGLLRCGECGRAMIPQARAGRPDVYLCIGRRDYGPSFCGRSQVRREQIDEAMLGQLTSRYFDLDATRDRLRDRLANELPLAQAAVADAERELLAVNAEARLAKIKRGWQEDFLTDDEYRTQRAEVESEDSAAEAAVEQARRNVETITTTGMTTDAEEALLRHLADLKRLVSGTVDRARDTEALRTVIRQLFASVQLCEPGFQVFAQHGEGVLCGDAGGHVPAGSWTLVLRMREEMFDWDTVGPIKLPLPEELTTSTYR